MPITAIWKCDGCGKESTEAEQPKEWARGQMNVRKTFNKIGEWKSQDLVLCPVCWRMITSGKLADVPDYTRFDLIDQGLVHSLPPLKTPVNNNARLIRKVAKTKRKVQR